MIDKQAQEIEDRATKRAESKYAENISKSKVVMKRDIMSLKEKYFDILMNSLKIRLQDFVRSNEYKTYLYKNISKLNNELNKYDKLDLVIHLSQLDFNKYGDYITKEISKKHSISLRTIDIIGGFIAEIPSKSIKFDLSINSVLDDNKTFIMQTLFGSLKAGEFND